MPLVIRDLSDTCVNVRDLLPPDTAAIDGVIVVNCKNVEFDFADVAFLSNYPAGAITISAPLIDVRDDSHGCCLLNVSHLDARIIDFMPLDWRIARRGLVIRGEKNQVKNCQLGGVTHGVWLSGSGSSLEQFEITGFSGDAVRVLANDCSVKNGLIECAFLGDAAEHSDAIQLFPLLPPEEQRIGELSGISISGVTISNDSTAIGQRWMQGITLTDGVLRNSTLAGISIDTDHPLGILLAQAHEVEFKNIVLANDISGVQIGTNKTGYLPSSGLRFANVQSKNWYVV